MRDYLKWIIPLTCILVGFLAGIVFEKIILKKLKKIAIKTQLPGNEILFRSLKGIPKIWFWVAGFYGGVISLQMQDVISVGIAGNMQKVLSAIFLYSVVTVLAKLADGFVTLLTQGIEGLSASLFSNLAKISVFVLGILGILQTLGFYIAPILASLGIGGLVVALAFQETLSNFYSGLYLIISQQVKTGDYVKLETGQEGYVTDITWRNTVIKEIPHNIVVVPNSKLASAIFNNYHLPIKEITLQVKASVSYDSDLEKVEKVTIEVAKEVMQEIASNIIDFEPFVLYEEFGEYSIHLTAFLRVNEFIDQRIARHKFIKKLHQRYQEEEITIPFPTRQLYLQENRER